MIFAGPLPCFPFYPHPIKKHPFMIKLPHKIIFFSFMSLDPERDSYVARMVREIVTHYTPRFASIPSEVHPFLPVISDSYITKLFLPYLSSPNIHPDASSVCKIIFKKKLDRFSCHFFPDFKIIAYNSFQHIPIINFAL